MAEEATITEETTEAETEPTTGSEEKTLPNDLFSDDIPKDNANPMDGPTKEKEYGALPNEENKEAGKSETTSSESSTSPEAKPQPTTTAPLTPEEKQNQAKMTVDLMFKGYEKLHALGRFVGKQDDAELMQLHNAGKIDLEYELPLGTQKVSVGDFFKEYNSGIEQNIVVSDDFKNSVRPSLERIAIKRGWFVSDELYVGMLLAEDLSTKVSMLMGLKKSCSMVLQACIEIQKKELSQKTTQQQERPGESEEKESAQTTNEEWREE